MGLNWRRLKEEAWKQWKDLKTQDNSKPTLIDAWGLFQEQEADNQASPLV